MRTIIFILIAASAAAQTFYTVEDHKGLTASAATRANPMVITTTQDHGFATMAAQGYLKVSLPTEGATVTINAVTYTYKADLTGCSARDVKRWTTADDGGITQAVADNRNVASLVAAIMGSDTGYVYNGTKTILVSGMEGTYFCAGTTASTHVEAWNPFSMRGSRAIVGVRSLTPGPTGKWAVSASGGSGVKWTFWYHNLEPTYYNATTLEIVWYVLITNATGSWAPIGQSIPGKQPPGAGRVVVYVDTNQFKIPAVDSSGFTEAELAGQIGSWRINRAMIDGSNNPAPMVRHSTLQGGAQVSQEGAQVASFPNCETGTAAATCGQSFWSGDNSLAYGKSRHMASPSIVVSGGVATITHLAGSTWLAAGSYYKSEAVGVRVWPRGFHKYYLTAAILSAADNGGDVQLTTAAHNCVAGDQAYVSGLSGVGVADGTYSITIDSSTTVTLAGTTFGGTGTGTISCNPHGRQANDALRQWALGGTSAYEITAIDANTTTIAAPLIPDGEYTGTCVPTGAVRCVGTSHQVYPYLIITAIGQPYFNIYGYNNDAFTQSDLSIWPNSKIWFHAKETIPITTPPTMFRHWVKITGKRLKRHTAGSGSGLHQGTYIKSTMDESGQEGNSQGHYYDILAGNNFYDDEWVAFDAMCPGVANPGGIGERPCYINMGEYWWPIGAAEATSGFETGVVRPYVANLGIFYLSYPYPGMVYPDASYPDPALSYVGSSGYIGLIQAGIDNDQPNGWVRQRTSTWAAARYANGGVGSDAAPSIGGGYEMQWASMPYCTGCSFEVRYSTAGSIRTGGWSGASAGGNCSGGGDGNTTPCTVDNTAFGGTTSYWQSPDMARQAAIWVAIRPNMPIVGSSISGENTIIQFKVEADGASYQVGDSVTVAGAGGGRDGSKTIAEILPRRTFFTYLPDHNTAAAKYTEAGTLSGPIVCGSGICTIEFTEAHGLTSGMLVGLSDTNNVTLGQSFSTFDAHKKYVATVVDTDTITIPSALTGSFTNFATCPGATCRPMKLHVYPGWRLTGTNSGAWSGTGTAKSAENNRGFAEIYFPEYAGASTPAITMVFPPAGASLTVTEGETNQVVIPFSSSGGALGNFSVSDNQAWASVSPTSGTTATDLTVTVDATSLTAGSYQVDVTVSSTTEGVTNSPQVIPVSVTVTEGSPIPTLSLDTNTVTWNYVIGGALPANQVVTATATAPGAEVTSSFTGCSWLTVTPTSGNTPQEFTFAADVTPGDSAIAAGSYPCTVTMTGTGEVNGSPTDVTVTLNITALPSNVTGRAAPSDTRALVRYHGPGLATGAPCVVTLLDGITEVDSQSDSGGGAARSVEFPSPTGSALTPSTAYQATLACGIENGGSMSFTTLATDPGGAARWPGTPPSGKPKMHIQYGPSEGEWTDYVYDCTGKSCASAAEAPSVVRSPGRILYLRRRWLTGAQDENTSTATAPFGPVRIIF